MSLRNAFCFLLRGVGGATRNEHKFPFFGDIELVEQSTINHLGGHGADFPERIVFSATLQTYFFLDTHQTFFNFFFAKLTEEFFYNMVLQENRKKNLLGLN